jgi:DNA-binding protein H-NS
LRLCEENDPLSKTFLGLKPWGAQVNIFNKDYENVEVAENPNHQSPSIAAETARNGKMLSETSDLALMSVDELWNLHQKIETILAAKMVTELKELGKRLDQLNAKVTTGQRESREHSKPMVANRRPYPSVLPKYRNANPPFETWAGRGKHPRWLMAQLGLGRRLEDFRIR